MEVKGNFINYGNYVDVHDNEVVNLTVGDGEVKVGKQPARFPASLDYAQGAMVLQSLKDGTFVPKETEPMNFLYQMGCTDERPDEVQPIVWLKNKELLREMLESWFKSAIENETVKLAKLEAVCPQVFVDAKGEMNHLAKRKVVASIDSDKIAEIFATI